MPTQHNATEKTRTAFAGLITRERDPLNLEYPFAELSTAITPSNQFFVRSHFEIPVISPTSWKLRCRGHVKKKFSLSLEQIKEFPSQTVTATMECAGNSRVYLVPKEKGVLWELGAVGTAEYTGVPLAVVLEQAGVKEGATEVILQGADKGELVEEPKTPGVIHYARSLPIEKAMSPEVLLAYQMNGEDLTPEHGYPLRAIVPGWYGMASVKWLQSIEVIKQPFLGYWQTSEYSYWRKTSGEPVLEAVTAMQVKSEIARPGRSEAVSAGSVYRIFGAAWSDGAEIAKVEISLTGGKTWHNARLRGESVPFSWRLWEYEWNVPKTPNKYVLMSRATDDQGRQQPAEHDVFKKAYLINHTLPLEVESR